MIVNKYGNGGGSASGVTPEQVQQEIQSALTPYWESGITKEYVDSADTIVYASATSRMDDVEEIVSSALNEFHEQIMEVSAATSGKADAANVTANTTMKFPLWNEQGVITGTTGNNLTTTGFYLNGTRRNLIKEAASGDLGDAYAPTSPGSAGQILVSTGNGAPVWSSVTMPDTEEIELPIAAAVNKLKGDFEARLDQQYYKKQETNNLLKEKVTAGQVDVQIKNYTDPLFQAVHETIEDKELPVSAAINELNEAINLIDEVVPAALVNLNETKVGSESVHTIWRGTQIEYDAITTKDASTLYIIVNE